MTAIRAITRIQDADDYSTFVSSVCSVNDARLSDQRTPLDGSVTSAKIVVGGLSPSSVTGTAVITTDGRLSDQRTPLDGSVTSTKIAGGGLSASSITGTAVITTDSRLSDARTPLAHATSHSTGGLDAISPWNISARFAGQIVTPEQYGAVGNGTSDDTSPVQQALDTGLPVYLGKSYKITAKLTFKTPLQAFFGDGLTSRIIFDGSVTPVAMGMLDTTQRTGIVIRDLRITSTTPGTGLAIDASYFAISRFHGLLIEGVNQGIDFNANGTYYNHVMVSRINPTGVGGFAIRFANVSNENTVERVRISPGDANASGIIVNNSTANELNSVDVETGALVAIDIQTGSHGTVINAPYLEANQTNLKIASGVQALLVVGGVIESATVANITNLGGDAEFVNVRLQFASYNFSTMAKTYNPGTTPVDALILDMAQPTVASTLRDSHNIVLRGAYADAGGVGHSLEWKIVNNITSNTGGGKLRFMNHIDSATLTERMNLDGAGTLTISGGLRIGRTAVTNADATITSSNGIVEITTSNVNRVATLQTASGGGGRKIQVRKIDNGTGIVTVTPQAGETIVGHSTYVLYAQYDAVMLVADGTSNWNIEAEYPARTLHALSTQTANYTITDGNRAILADATGGAITITLPTAVGRSGTEFIVKRFNGGSNSVTVATTSSQTIDGATTFVLTAQYMAIRVVSDGSNWYII